MDWKLSYFSLTSGSVKYWPGRVPVLHYFQSRRRYLPPQGLYRKTQFFMLQIRVGLRITIFNLRLWGEIRAFYITNSNLSNIIIIFFVCSPSYFFLFKLKRLLAFAHSKRDATPVNYNLTVLKLSNWKATNLFVVQSYCIVTRGVFTTLIIIYEEVFCKNRISRPDVFSKKISQNSQENTCARVSFFLSF